jgi:hypothetical protein
VFDALQPVLDPLQPVLDPLQPVLDPLQPVLDPLQALFGALLPPLRSERPPFGALLPAFDALRPSVVPFQGPLLIDDATLFEERLRKHEERAHKPTVHRLLFRQRRVEQPMQAADGSLRALIVQEQAPLRAGRGLRKKQVRQKYSLVRVRSLDFARDDNVARQGAGVTLSAVEGPHTSPLLAIPEADGRGRWSRAAPDPYLPRAPRPKNSRASLKRRV